MICVLVIEDDNILNQQLCGLILDNGYSTISAMNEKEAESVLHDHGSSIAIAIVDMLLPAKAKDLKEEEAGLRLIKLMTERYHFIVKVVYTGHANLQNAAKCMEAGAFSYCEKGGEPDEFLETIKNAEIKYRRDQLIRKGVISLRSEIKEVQECLNNLEGAVESLFNEVLNSPEDNIGSN